MYGRYHKRYYVNQRRIQTTIDLARKGLDVETVDKMLEKIPSKYSIKYIHLQENNLTEIPVSVLVFFPNLEYLNVRQNKIKIIPKAVENLKLLRSLYAGSNEIEEIHCLPPMLRSLGIFNNPISKEINHPSHGAKNASSYKPLFRELARKKFIR